MRKGDAVAILANNPLIGHHGIHYAYVVEEGDKQVGIRLLCQQKVVVKSEKCLLTVIDHEQVPRELQKFLPENKMSQNELRERLVRLERKITQIGMKLGLVPDVNDPYTI